MCVGISFCEHVKMNEQMNVSMEEYSIKYQREFS
jgi:hypothetical protein